MMHSRLEKLLARHARRDLRRREYMDGAANLSDLSSPPGNRLDAMKDDRGRRDITPSTALRLSRFFGTTPDLWMNLQLRVDLWKAIQKEGRAVARIQPLRAAAAG